VAHALFRGAKSEAVKWAKEWLNLEGEAAPVPARRAAAPPAPRATPQEDRDYDRRRALAIYCEARPELRGTPVDRYLQGRGIALERLGRSPRALRFHPHLRYRTTELYFPAMVALVDDGDGQVISIHRTYLQARADGRVTKADVPEPKLTLGSYKGGAIRLWRGRLSDGRMRPPLKDCESGETIVLTEGIENGLSVALACPEHRVLAGISLSNLASIALPKAVGSVIIFADNDQGAQAQAGLERAIAAHAQAGRTVRIARAPAGFKDVNDWLRGQGKESAA
jgi:hypothetical protein